MAIYKLLKDPISGKDDTVIKTISKTSNTHRYLCIPFVEDNGDYQEYLAWVAKGNTPEAAD